MLLTLKKNGHQAFLLGRIGFLLKKPSQGGQVREIKAYSELAQGIAVEELRPWHNRHEVHKELMR